MLNKMIIIGNVGRDAELHYTANGKPVADFSVAVNNRYTGAEQSRDETEWFKVTAWDRLAETVHEHVVKGMKVYVEGRIKLEKWKGQDGIERSQNNITAQQITFLNRPDQSASPQQGSGQPASRQSQPARPVRQQVGSQQRPVQRSQPAGAASQGRSAGPFGDEAPPW